MTTVTAIHQDRVTQLRTLEDAWRRERKAYDQGPAQEFTKLTQELEQLQKQDDAPDLKLLACEGSVKAIALGFRVPFAWVRRESTSLESERVRVSTDGPSAVDFTRATLAACKSEAQAAREHLDDAESASGLSRDHVGPARGLAQQYRDEAEALILKARWIEGRIAPTDAAMKAVVSAEAKVGKAQDARDEAIAIEKAVAKGEADRVKARGQRIAAIRQRLTELEEAKKPLEAAWTAFSTLRDKPAGVVLT